MTAPRIRIGESIFPRLTLASMLAQLRADLEEEATPLPGQQKAFGRPHAHPRARYFPRYTPTGERLAGAVVIRPDCPRPLRGRCECPPDGSWRPAVGVIRADSVATHSAQVPASRLRIALEGTLWVDEVYEQGPDGLWRCRWPVRRALEALRGVNPVRWAAAIALIRGVALANVWGATGAPPDPQSEAIRLLRLIDRRAEEERVTEWERRPRQWWDKPRKPNTRPVSKSEAQTNAEHEPNGSGGLTAQLPCPPEIGAPARGLRSVSGSDLERGSTPRPARPRTMKSATASPSLVETACA